MSTQLGLFGQSNTEDSSGPDTTKLVIEQTTQSPVKPLDLSWKDLLSGEFTSDYYKELREFVRSERAAGKTIYPPDNEIFNALSYTPFNSVKVVILGQDPYHGPNQAHGLCFSVKPPTRPPPSLVNIFKELKSDLGISPPPSGSLEQWARNGVLLLNAILSVEAGKPGSHQGRGWERFTDRIVELLNTQRQGLVFLLWGSHAQKKGSAIDPQRHCVLQAPHPSPFSADRGFFGCKHFSRANEYLRANGQAPIDWRL